MSGFFFSPPFLLPVKNMHLGELIHFAYYGMEVATFTAKTLFYLRNTSLFPKTRYVFRLTKLPNEILQTLEFLSRSPPFSP